MKLIYLFLFCFLISCGDKSPDSSMQNFDATDSIKEFDMNSNRLSAVEFNNELTLMQERTLDLIYDLFQSDSASVEINLENALFELDVNIQNVRGLYKDGDEAVEYARVQLNLLNFYSNELNGKFTELIPLLKTKNLNKNEIDELNDYDVYFAEQEKIWFDSVFVAQEKFAKANNIKLEE